jgi:hypothetical protein
MFVRWATPQPAIDLKTQRALPPDQQRTAQRVRGNGLRRDVLSIGEMFTGKRLAD